MRCFCTLALLVIVAGDQLRIDWVAAPRNHKLVVLYNCDKDRRHPPFLAVNEWDIDPGSSGATVHRVRTPPGQRCWITAVIMQDYDGWDGNLDTMIRAEWQILTHIEGAQ